uniref:VPS9 domain-containing protein n=1 Tax=Strigamia maritima TaxID=126957 RepID=T1JA31_STRMM
MGRIGRKLGPNMKMINRATSEWWNGSRGHIRFGFYRELRGRGPFIFCKERTRNFIVRKSSKNNTMAISVRLPDDKGPYIEHYLIEHVGREYRLEGSDNYFEAIPTLVSHYCQCCDELPVELSLPCAVAQACSRQELSSLAMLGQDYWVSSLAKSPTDKTHVKSSTNNALLSSPVLTTFGQRITVSSPCTTKPFQGSTTSLTSTNCDSIECETTGLLVKPANPPPPPPRWCKPVTTTNPNPDRPHTSSPKRPQALVDTKNGKVVRRKKKSTHYTHSNIVDSPPDYYRSSLADKISDYEDIWATPCKPEMRTSNKTVELVTFKPPMESNSSPMTAKRSNGTENGHKTEGISTSDASSSKSSPASTLSSSPSSQTSRLRNKLGLTIATGSSSSPSVNKKHSSPFYAEPADSLTNVANGPQRRKVHPKPVALRLLNHRHSDPNIQWPAAKNGGVLETIYASDETPATTLSSSLDNLNGHKRLVRSRARIPSSLVDRSFPPSEENRVMVDTETQTTPNTAKGRGDLPNNVSVPKLIPKLIAKKGNDCSWPVDSSWEWLGNENETLLGDSDDDQDSDDVVTVETILKKDAKFPLVEFRKELSMDSNSLDRVTVEDLIQQKSPDLHVPEIQPLTKSNLLRVSEYDNLGDSSHCHKRSVHERDNLAYAPSESASSMTEFSEPWDSSRWEQILQMVREPRMEEVIEEKNAKNVIELLPLDVVNEAVINSRQLALINDDDGTSISSLPTVDIDRDSSYCTQGKICSFMPSTYIFMLRNKNKDLGDSIREYVLRLSQDKSTTFGKTIENFIQCTLDSQETSPHIVMRNVRQFMSGIKNYLVKHGEGQFEMVVQMERSKLKANEFLNLDAILEGVLHKIVIKPLKKHIYQLFVNEYTKNGDLKLLSDNIKYARSKTPEEFGVKSQFTPPKGSAMDTVHHFLRRLQQVYSPMRKLENLLTSTACIFSSLLRKKLKTTKMRFNFSGNFSKLDVWVCEALKKNYLPMLMYVLVHCGMIAAEIEADYMWGLLHPSLLTGEGGYYLTTLSSAVHVLKNFQKWHVDRRKEINSIDNKEVF